MVSTLLSSLHVISWVLTHIPTSRTLRPMALLTFNRSSRMPTKPPLQLPKVSPSGSLRQDGLNLFQDKRPPVLRMLNPIGNRLVVASPLIRSQHSGMILMEARVPALVSQLVLQLLFMTFPALPRWGRCILCFPSDLYDRFRFGIGQT